MPESQQMRVGKRDNGRVVYMDLEKLVASRMLVQSNSGGGKSFFLRKIAERAAPLIQTVVIDQEGEFATLREKFDFALVGEGGELRASVDTAARVGRRIVENRIPAIIDLSDMRKSMRSTYVAEFLNAIMSCARKHWHPMLVIIDEAHDFCPERGGHKETPSASAVIDLMCQGRKRGFCGCLATQRLSKLSKDAAAECVNIAIGRTNLDVDIARAADVMGLSKVDGDRFRQQVPGWWTAFGPAFVTDVSGERFEFEVEAVETTHPEPGKSAAIVPPAPSKGVKALAQELQDLESSADPDDPPTLETARARIQELRLEVDRQARAVTSPDDIRVKVEAAMQKGFREGVAAAAKALLTNREKIQRGMSEVMRTFRAVGQSIEQATEALSVADEAVAQAFDTKASLPETPIKSSLPDRPVHRWMTPPKADKPSTATLNGVSKPYRKIIDSLAWWDMVGVQSPDKVQVAHVAGYSPRGGTFERYLSGMSSEGLIERDSGCVRLTQLGWSTAPALGTPTLAELHDKLLNQVGGGPRKILEVVIAGGNQPQFADTIASSSGYEASGGTFQRYLSTLSSLGLIDRGGGRVTPTSVVFPKELA